MSILDDAIREHLALKRAHGADESELKRLEDEAFGPPGRPDEPSPFAEAPTEFLAAPEGGEAGSEGPPGRRINIADLQEPPPPEAPAEEGPAMEHEVVPQAPSSEDTGEETALEETTREEPAAPPEAEADDEDVPPAEAEAGPGTGERDAIAAQPTELFDVEAELEPEAPATEAPSPSDEEIAEAELAEPRLSPGGRSEELAPAEEFEHEDDEDDDFWNEQRLSDELDQALDSPVTDEHELPPEDELPPPPAAVAPLEDTDEHEYLPEDEHEADHGQAEHHHEPEGEHEDVLEDTPEFLEDAPEDDELWFEQRPPKDFDFDD